jgi:protein-S-isoprenylcysteine O-methyltransferase Ste14
MVNCYFSALAPAQSPSPPIAVSTALCMLACYVVAARIEERKFEASAVATAYAIYRTRTGLLWPGI